MKLKEPDFMSSAYWTQQYKNKYGTTSDRILYVNQNHTRGSHDHATVTFEMRIDVTGHVTVLPQGKLEVSNTGGGDPDWRERNEKRYGVLIRQAKELSGKLQCPHTGRKIPVSRIDDNPVLWVDLEHKVAIKAGRVGYDFPDGKPYKVRAEDKHYSHRINYSFDNPKRFKAFEKRWRALWAEAKLRLSVMVVEPRAYPSMSAMWDVFLRDDVTTVEEAMAVQGLGTNVDEVTRMWQFCMCVHGFNLDHEHYRDLAKQKCVDHYSANELIFVG